MKYYYFDEAFFFVAFLDVAGFDAVAGFFNSEDFLLTVAYKASLIIIKCIYIIKISLVQSHIPDISVYLII